MFRVWRSRRPSRRLQLKTPMRWRRPDPESLRLSKSLFRIAKHDNAVQQDSICLNLKLHRDWIRIEKEALSIVPHPNFVAIRLTSCICHGSMVGPLKRRDAVQMNLEIAGHVALVTGGGRGLGAEMCLALGEEGCKVAVWDRDDAAEEVAACIRSAGGEALAVVGDVTDSTEVQTIVSGVLAQLGSVEILVNCAGFSRDAPIAEMTDSQWLDVINVNLNGPFYVTRAVAPTMQKNHYGRIVNISSRAKDGDNFKSNYSAAKMGVVGFTMALALELGKQGITVNAIAPGFCETERTRNLPYYRELKARALEKTPTDRLGTGRDIADGLLYLVGKRAGYITGEVIEIAGGRWR